jgi:hypothetical protein
LLTSEDLSREALPNFFHFLRMVLGDEVDGLQQRCVEVHDSLKATFGDAFTWEMFYTDDRAKLVLYEVLMRIADAFKRFDARKDWFISLMQYQPANIGIASNVFVPNARRDKTWTFGEADFLRMFRHLFAPVRSLSAQERELFTKSFGVTPEEAFAALFRHIG